MINLLSLNKLLLALFLFFISFNNFVFATDPVDIWKQKEEKNVESEKINEESKVKSLILIDDSKENEISINEEKVDLENSIIGLFDPKKNNFNLYMWVRSDGTQIKKIINRINKLKLSKFSENLLFQTLFTNAYPPEKNLTADEFLDIKIDWLIKNNKVDELENFLKINKQVGKKPKATQSLIEEYLATANIKSACEKIKFVDKSVEDNFLEKFNIYCLIYEDRGGEAQLMLDLLKERGFKDNFFENKINFLLGTSDTTSQKILDNNLFNFYLSQITSRNFTYQPTEKTNKYIWRYLSAANLIQIENFENEETIRTYEKAASSGTYEKKEIFDIYKKVIFNINQLLNSHEIYKTLPSYKSRALIYQSILISDGVEKKLKLAFLLKDLFDADKIFNVYSEELSNILKSIDVNSIPESYMSLVDQYSQEELRSTKNIKFDNNIIHKSKILKYFLEEDYNIKKIEKDLKNVYKKIKKNKKYFISIQDIIVLESLQSDGINLPDGLNLEELSSKLTIPENLDNLTTQNQVGLVMLKVVEIVGEDNIEDLDPETLYFLNKVLNKLKLKKIRNNILGSTFPTRI